MNIPFNPTKRYAQRHHTMGVGLSHLIDNKPWFTYWDVPRLVRDPFVSFLRRIWCSPLQNVKFKIRSTSPEVTKTAERALKTFWRKGVPAIMRRYFLWGYAPAGFEYESKRGRWVLDNVRPIEPRDAKVRIFTKGRRAGEFAGFDTQSTGTVLSPYAFWFAGAGEFGGHYDIPPAASLWDAWTEYGTRGGARSLRQLYMRKHSISPAQLRYPEGTTTWTSEDGSSTVYNNKDLALLITEYYESGANVVLPSDVFENGKPKWELIPADVKGDALSISNYPNALKEEMAEAVGMPYEVIKASETGSGYSGRSVPYRTWLGTMDEYAGMLLASFERNPLQHLIKINHGPQAECEIEPVSLVEMAERADNPEMAAAMMPGQTTGAPQQFEQPQQEFDTSDGVSPDESHTLATSAMLELQERAVREGDPHKYDKAIEHIKKLAQDPQAMQQWVDSRS